MTESGWRYIAFAEPSGELIHSDLPLTGVSITDVLSGPCGLSGALPTEIASLKGADGKPLIAERGASIWAEQDGIIRGGGIVDTLVPNNNELAVECVGFSGAIQGQPYTGNGKVWTRVDPLDVVRAIWAHWQSHSDADLQVIVDGTTSPVQIGEEQYVAIWTEQAGSDTTFDEGPIRLNWWSTSDMGAMIDDYVKRGFFDYHEENAWNADRTGIVHRLRLFYPRMGARRHDLRFAIGENIAIVPSTSMVEEGYASEVMVLGAGEGREKIQARVGGPTGRLRKVAVIVDDKIKRQSEAYDRARAELRKRQGLHEITEVGVRDHPHAPLGSWQVGDEVHVVGPAGWVEIDEWTRILSSTISPKSGDVASLSVKRVPT